MEEKEREKRKVDATGAKEGEKKWERVMGVWVDRGGYSGVGDKRGEREREWVKWAELDMCL